MIKAYAASKPGGTLTPFEYDPGELGPEEVELDVLYCGVCHTDLGMIDNEWAFSQYPLVPGHEIIGRVASIGVNVGSLKVGQTVGLGFHSGYCLACEHCDSGDHNLCADARPIMAGRHGGFADKVRAQATSLVPIPDSLDLASAGPLFCAGITVFNPFVQFNIKPSDKVAVVGIGGLGHLALQIANAWGCEVTAFTSSELKLKEAKTLGAHTTLNSRDPEQIETAGRSFDLILSTVDISLDWHLYLRALKPRGRLHILGASAVPLDITPIELMSSQLSVSGSTVGSPATISMMLDFLTRHNIKPVVEMYYFDEINEAIARLRSGKAHYRLVLQHR